MATESFVSQLGQEVEVPGFGFVRFDISYGGAFYAIPPASQIGLSLMETPLAHLVRAGVAVTETVRGAIPINHPDEPDLGFLYGTILTDDVDIGNICGRPSYNICIFAEGQIDRSPTGSGVTARLALAAAKGQMEVGQSCEIRGVSGRGFVGTLARTHRNEHGIVSRVKVSGAAFYSGRCFELPAKFADHVT